MIGDKVEIFVKIPGTGGIVETLPVSCVDADIKIIEIDVPILMDRLDSYAHLSSFPQFAHFLVGHDILDEMGIHDDLPVGCYVNTGIVMYGIKVHLCPWMTESCPVPSLGDKV